MTPEEIAVRLAEVDARAKSNTKRLDEHDVRLEQNEKLVTAVSLMAQKQETLESDVKEIKSDIKDMKDEPGKRWKDLRDKIVWAVVAAALTFVLSRIGL